MHAIQLQTRDQNFRVLDLSVNMRAHATGSTFWNEHISSHATDGGMMGSVHMFSVSTSAVPPGLVIACTVRAPQRVPCSRPEAVAWPPLQTSRVIVGPEDPRGGAGPAPLQGYFLGEKCSLL